MAEIEIITLSPGDWQQYKELRLEALLRSPEAFTTRYEDAVESPDSYWQGRLLDAARPGQGERMNWLLFARSEGRLVGMIGAFFYTAGGTAEIVSVYVSPEARGQGVGRLLMEAILAELERVPGVRQVELVVNSGQAAAFALYQKMGFAVVDETEALAGDGKVHRKYTMRRPMR